MTFGTPIFLLALLLLPLGFAAAWAARRNRRRHAVRLPTAGTLAALAPRRSRLLSLLPAVLLSGAVATLAVALARPQITVDVPVERATVMLVTDASGSMRAEDVEPTRLDAAREAIHSFLGNVPDEMRIGLIAFSSAVERLHEPSQDHDAVADAADTITAGGGTATGDALRDALGAIQEQAGEQGTPPAAVLLLSDGMTSQGVDPLTVAEEARELGIPVSTVALGTPEGVVQLAPGTQPRPVPPDPETLRRIAEISGGEAFEIDDAGELSSVYEKVGRQLGTTPERREITGGVGGVGALLLVGAVALGLRRRGVL